MLPSSDEKFLMWIYDRLINNYSEDPDTEHMKRLALVAKRIEKLEDDLLILQCRKYF